MNSESAYNEAEEQARYFVQVWAEAVIRQAERTRAIRQQFNDNSRAYDYNEDWSPPEEQLLADFRQRWAEEHTLVWSAFQLEQWRGRLAAERGETAPAENEKLKLARDALEHLSEAAFRNGAAVSPRDKGQQGKALRAFPSKALDISLGDGPLFTVLDDPEGIDREALGIVRSIEDELDSRAQAAYEALMEDELRGR